MSTTKPDDAVRPIWDGPTRLFHWTLAALIGFCWWSGENGQLEWHMIAGSAILGLLLFRFLWGVIGGSTARFRQFVTGPAGVMRYLKAPGDWRGIGHNPLGALSVLALLAAITVQVGFGLFSTDVDGLVEAPLARFVSVDMTDWARSTHNSFFNVVLALAGLHIAAILYYVLRGKNLVRPMITGRGPVTHETLELTPAGRTRAIACALIAAGLAYWVYRGLPPF